MWCAQLVVVDFGYEFKQNDVNKMMQMHAMTQVRAASEEEIAEGKEALLARIEALKPKPEGGCCAVM